MGKLQRKINKSKKAKLYYLIQGKDIDETIDIATGNVEKLFKERCRINRINRLLSEIRYPSIPKSEQDYRELYQQEFLPPDHPYKEQPDEVVHDHVPIQNHGISRNAYRRFQGR